MDRKNLTIGAGVALAICVAGGLYMYLTSDGETMTIGKTYSSAKIQSIYI
jgi:hypothetical protein